MAFFAAPLLQVFCAALRLRPVSTTAVFSAIRCRCGMAFIAASFPQAFCAALPFRPVSITAAFSAIRCRCGTTLWKVPTEAAFLHHLLEFVISRPAPEASLAGHAREPHPEGAGESAVCPSPSRLGTWQHLTPSEGATFMWHYVRPPSVFLFSVSWKVPGETAFLHHLLEFVISGPAPEASLAGPAREPLPEGAGESAVYPSPSRIRYKRTCPRSVPRRPCPGTPSGRCRRKCRLPVTFSFGYVAAPHSFGRSNVYVALCASPVSIPVFCFLESAG